jgi:hypothetical protein
MKAAGILFAVLGVALVLGGFVMDGAASGQNVLNIGLLNAKLMLVVAGGSAFISGMVLGSAAEIVDGLQEKRSLAETNMGSRASVREVASPNEPRSEVWRKSRAILTTKMVDGQKVYILDDNTVAVDGIDWTFSDVANALSNKASAGTKG